MGLVNYAKKELELLGSTDDEMQKTMNKHILEIVKVFSEQGHSGFSGAYVVSTLTRLLSFKPLKPLTGEDDEWNEISEGKFQNKRCSSVFKNSNDGTAYDINGKIFTDDGGKTWYTNRESRVNIEFPYTVPEKPERVYLEE